MGAHVLRMWLVVVLASLVVNVARGQSPTAATQNGSIDTPLEFAISQGSGSNPEGVFQVVGLTPDADHQTPHEGFLGPIVLVNSESPSAQLQINSSVLAVVSCDPYSGSLQPSDVFTFATERNATAVLFYSTTQDSCTLGGSNPDYTRVYSMNAKSITSDMLDVIKSLNTAFGHIAVRGTIPNDTNPDSGSNSQSQQQQNQNPLGPSPSTAVAMIILYSITGIITALFLVIIITGAVRAHRHPERYGPRNGIGRPRQSRARGLARAMLETIPIVKFGDREQDYPKPTDVELADGSHGSVEVLPDQNATQQRSGEAPAVATHTSSAGNQRSAAPESDTQESGIAPAVNTERPKTPETTQGCSICTEDFEVGQDQRVLPCDHRFHPECIDPWLLNVSGTCPLCRIDLRPANTRSSEDELDENGNPIPRPEGGDHLAPPLETDNNRRMSVRRSLLVGLMGVRPERMTREERVTALRQLRQQRDATRQASAAAEPAEEESSTRRRLRNAFRIRTSRTGADGRAEQPDAT